MSKKKSRVLRFFKRLGLAILGFFVLLIVIAIITPDKKDIGVQQSQEVESDQQIQTVKLNSCKLDEANADYWQGKQVNFWNSPERESVVFTLPACEDLELEIIASEGVEGGEVYKIRYQGKEGWISKIQLME